MGKVYQLVVKLDQVIIGSYYYDQSRYSYREEENIFIRYLDILTFGREFLTFF